MGSEGGRAHEAFYRRVAEHYDRLCDSKRVSKATPFLDDLFRRHGHVREVLDVACGTFAIDRPLVREGYRVVGRDRSAAMVKVARGRSRDRRRRDDVAVGDKRTLQLSRTFDAVLCLGTAFNYLTNRADIHAALRTMRRHLRKGGILVLDLTNFDAWIRKPTNARAEVDFHAPNGDRITIFGYNDQDLARRIHVARFLTVLRQRGRMNLLLDEAPLRIWTKRDIGETLRRNGFRPIEWWGDLRLGARYASRKSPRPVSVSLKT